MAKLKITIDPKDSFLQITLGLETKINLHDYAQELLLDDGQQANAEPQQASESAGGGGDITLNFATDSEDVSEALDDSYNSYDFYDSYGSYSSCETEYSVDAIASDREKEDAGNSFEQDFLNFLSSPSELNGSSSELFLSSYSSDGVNSQASEFEVRDSNEEFSAEEKQQVMGCLNEQRTQRFDSLSPEVNSSIDFIYAQITPLVPTQEVKSKNIESVCELIKREIFSEKFKIKFKKPDGSLFGADDFPSVREDIFKLKDLILTAELHPESPLVFAFQTDNEKKLLEWVMLLSSAEDKNLIKVIVSFLSAMPRPERRVTLQPAKCLVKSEGFFYWSSFQGSWLEACLNKSLTNSSNFSSFVAFCGSLISSYNKKIVETLLEETKQFFRYKNLCFLPTAKWLDIFCFLIFNNEELKALMQDRIKKCKSNVFKNRFNELISSNIKSHNFYKVIEENVLTDNILIGDACSLSFSTSSAESNDLISELLLLNYSSDESNGQSSKSGVRDSSVIFSPEEGQQVMDFLNEDQTQPFDSLTPMVNSSIDCVYAQITPLISKKEVQSKSGENICELIKKEIFSQKLKVEFKNPDGSSFGADDFPKVREDIFKFKKLMLTIELQSGSPLVSVFKTGDKKTLLEWVMLMASAEDENLIKVITGFINALPRPERMVTLQTAKCLVKADGVFSWSSFEGSWLEACLNKCITNSRDFSPFIVFCGSVISSYNKAITDVLLRETTQIFKYKNICFSPKAKWLEIFYFLISSNEELKVQMQSRIEKCKSQAVKDKFNELMSSSIINHTFYKVVEADQLSDNIILRAGESETVKISAKKPSRKTDLVSNKQNSQDTLIWETEAIQNLLPEELPKESRLNEISYNEFINEYNDFAQVRPSSVKSVLQPQPLEPVVEPVLPLQPQETIPPQVATTGDVLAQENNSIVGMKRKCLFFVGGPDPKRARTQEGSSFSHDNTR